MASAAAHDDRGTAGEHDDHRQNQRPSETSDPPDRSEDGQHRDCQEEDHSRVLPDHRQRGICPLLVDFLTSHLSSVLRTGDDYRLAFSRASTDIPENPSR